MTPVVLNDTYDPASEKRPRKPVLCLRVYRDPSKFILIVCLPIMMIVLLALATFFAELGHGPYAGQFAATLTSALTVTTFFTTLKTRELPSDLMYLTYAEWYICTIFLFHVLMATRCMYRSSMPDVIQDENHDFVHAVKADLVLTAIWMIPHICFLSVAFMRGGEKTLHYKLLSYVREPWHEVVAKSLRALTKDFKHCEVEPFYSS